MKDSTMGIQDLIRTLKRRRQFILKIFLGAITSTLVVSLLFPRTYEAETSLRVKLPPGLHSSLLESPVSSLNNRQLMATYTEIIKSRIVVQPVIEKVYAGLEEPPPYKKVIERIAILPVRDTEILKIKVRARTPEEAQSFANTLVSTFVDKLAVLVRAEHTGVKEFIGQRLQESRAEVERTETALEQYKRDQKLLVISDQSKALVERLSYVSKLEAENTISLAMAQARLSSAERQLAKEKPGFVADNPSIQQLKNKLADYEVELVGLLRVYTEQHPKVISLRAAVEETKSKLNTEINRVVNADAPSLNPVHQGLMQAKIQGEAETSAAVAQKNAINRVINENERELSSLPSKERGMLKLIRDAQVAQELSIMLAKRYEEARINEVMQPTDVQVVDVAGLPEEPVIPKLGFNLVVVGLLSLLAGILVACYLEYVNKKILTSRDVRETFDLPILGVIPDFSANAGTRSKRSLLDKILDSNFVSGHNRKQRGVGHG